MSPWGGVNSSDALLVARFFGGGLNWSPLKIRAGDVNNNQIANGTDALIVNRRLTGQVSSFVVPDWLVHPAQLSWSGQVPMPLDWQVLCAGDVNASYQPAFSTGR
jgi:hypothetical protein